MRREAAERAAAQAAEAAEAAKAAEEEPTNKAVQQPELKQTATGSLGNLSPDTLATAKVKLKVASKPI